MPHHLALGTYVVFEGDSEYARRCFKEYAMLPDKSGRYAALYRPIHMIGLELGISVASAALRREPTGAPTGFRSDVVATAKRDLKKGEVLDGEGGFCVWGRQTPAERSLDQGLLPLGLAHNVRLKRDVAPGEPLRWADVDYDPNDLAVKVRREMEAAFGRRNVGRRNGVMNRQTKQQDFREGRHDLETLGPDGHCDASWCNDGTGQRGPCRGHQAHRHRFPGGPEPADVRGAGERLLRQARPRRGSEVHAELG